MVKITRELPLKEFEFWSGAESIASAIADGDWDILEREIQVQYPDGIDEKCLNDIFRFENDALAKELGYSDWEDYLLHNKEEDDG